MYFFRKQNEGILRSKTRHDFLSVFTLDILPRRRSICEVSIHVAVPGHLLEGGDEVPQPELLVGGVVRDDLGHGLVGAGQPPVLQRTLHLEGSPHGVSLHPVFVSFCPVLHVEVLQTWAILGNAILFIKLEIQPSFGIHQHLIKIKSKSVSLTSFSVVNRIS